MPAAMITARRSQRIARLTKQKTVAANPKPTTPKPITKTTRSTIVKTPKPARRLKLIVSERSWIAEQAHIQALEAARLEKICRDEKDDSDDKSDSKETDQNQRPEDMPKPLETVSEAKRIVWAINFAANTFKVKYV